MGNSINVIHRGRGYPPVVQAMHNIITLIINRCTPCVRGCRGLTNFFCGGGQGTVERNAVRVSKRPVYDLFL